MGDHLQNPVFACSYGMVCPLSGEAWCSAVKRAALPSTYKPEFMDGETGASTPEPLFMDECGKKPALSTTMAVYMDGKAVPSTITPVYMDNRQKKWHPSTYKPKFMDGETGASTKTALSVDNHGQKDILITLKEVDAVNVTNISVVPGVQSHVVPRPANAIHIMD